MERIFLGRLLHTVSKLSNIFCTMGAH